MEKTKRKALASIKYIFLILVLICTIYPLYWMAFAGTFDASELFSFFIGLLPGDQMANNYHKLALAFDIVRVVGNTFFVSIIGTVLSVLVNTMMGYAMAKYEFKWKKPIFNIFVVTLFVGGAAAMIPQFEIIMKLSLYNSLFAIILPAIYSPYMAFLARQSLLDFPSEILQAGRIDGCGEIQMFFKLVMPNIKAVVATIGIISFMGFWNGYLWNMIVTSSTDKYTLQVALASIYPNAGVWTYAPLKMLGATMSVIPILVIFVSMQKYFVNSISGAVKG